MGHTRPGTASSPGSSTSSYPTCGRFQHLRVTVSGGFRVGGARGKNKKGPSDDVILISQP